jgi:hypothetical protein
MARYLLTVEEKEPFRGKSLSRKGCQNADRNPSCPYLAQINQQAEDIRIIKKALIGDDMQGGIVAEITKLKSWTRTLAPFALIALSVGITYAVDHLGHL